MDSYRIGGDGPSLELRSHTRTADGETDILAITIRDGGLEATTFVDGGDIGFNGLEEFFLELAYSWRGWTGDVEYHSLEHDLTMSARHDGHIRLVVDLAPPHPATWSAHVELSIDPGEQLTEAVAAVTAVLGSKLEP
jgi:hypothetical protein